MPLKILHVIQCLTTGGAGRAALTMARRSREAGGHEHRLLSVLPCDPQAVELAAAHGVHVLAAPSGASLSAEAEAADILLVHWWNTPEIAEFLNFPLPPVRTALWLHVGGRSAPQVVVPDLLERADHVAACSPYTWEAPILQELLRQEGPDKASMLFASADLDRFLSLERHPHEGVVAGYAGTVDPVKMHTGFVDLCAAVRDPSVRFQVCGGPFHEDVRRKAMAAGLVGRMDVTGPVPDVAPFLASWDIFGYPLCPDTYAASELVVQEAMAAGLPTVVFPHGGVSRLVEHERTGLVADDAPSYARAVERLAADPELRARLGSAAREHARTEFHPGRWAREWNDRFERMARLPRRGHPQGIVPRRGRSWALQFADSLGPDGSDFKTSIAGTAGAAEADLRIARSSALVASAASGGILQHRNAHPDSPHLRLWTGLVLEERGLFEQAAMEIVQTLELGLADARTLWHAARIARKSGAEDVARSCLEKARQIDPGFEPAGEPARIHPPTPAGRKGTTAIVYGRNDSHGQNLTKRATISINCLALQLEPGRDEILFVDCNSADDVPTFPESIRDLLTERARSLLRVLRLRPHQFAPRSRGASAPVLEALCRNVALRRSSPSRPWILSTNTDIAVRPRSGTRLTDLVGDLPDALHGAPRFDIPQGLWETLDRTDPGACLERMGSWMDRLGLRVAAGAPWDFVGWDNPGDFQLFPREDLVSIGGFDESMVDGPYHVDSNMARRICLARGPVRSLESVLEVYHCDHSRQAMSRQNSTAVKGNDWNACVMRVSDPDISSRQPDWGAAGEVLEEIVLREPDRRFESALEALVRRDGTVLPVVPGNQPESNTHIPLDRILPFLVDHLLQLPKGRRISVLSYSDDICRALRRAGASLGLDAQVERIQPGAPGSEAALASNPDLMVVDPGTRNGPVPVEPMAGCVAHFAKLQSGLPPADRCRTLLLLAHQSWLGNLGRALFDLHFAPTDTWIFHGKAVDRDRLPEGLPALPAESPDRRPATAGGARPRIGFDGRVFSVPDSVVRGIGHYAFHHLEALLRARPDVGIEVLHDDREPVPPGIRSRLEALGARWAPWSSRTGEDYDLFHTPDPMFVFPGYPSPFPRFRGARTTATFHDVIPLRMYEGKVTNWPGYLARLEEVRDSGATLLCNSEFTRKDLMDATGIPPGRALAVMAGFNGSETARAWSDPEAKTVLDRLGIDKPFFLFVGTCDLHKNFEAALEASQRISRRRPAQLVVVGRLAHSIASVRDQILQAGIQDVVFTDFLPREELELLYSRSTATLFPSRYEGFGFPALEAMANGSPVVASDAASIPEVVGEAGLLHPPDDVEGMARSMERLLDDPELRRNLVGRGLERSRRFDWKDVADRTWLAWDDLLAGPRPAASAAPDPARIQWISPVWDPSGYADESRAFVRHLASTDLGVSLFAAGRHSESFRQAASPEDRRLFDGAMGRESVPGKPVVMALPASSLGRFPGCGHHVGRTTFETDGLPPDWVARCNSMDEIWVPCTFNRETFSKAGVDKPILVVPEGVDTDRFRPGLDPLPLPGPSRGTTFLAVFEWTHRKGPDLLLRAWAESFEPSDDVRLVLRTYPPNQIEGDPADWVESRIDEELARCGKRRSDCAPISVVAHQVPDADMPRLYAAADVFVAPSRGEGWGRPHMEAMSCGVPVVATRWSGNLDFQDDDNSWLIDVRGLEEIDAREEFPFYRGQKWASPSPEHLVAILRNAATSSGERKAKGERARRDMVGKWDWKRIAPLAEARLREILDGVPAVRSSLAKAAPPSRDRAPAAPKLLPAIKGRIPIAMPAYNRDRYLARVLDGLRRCRDLDRFFIVTGEEPGCPSTAALFDAVDWMPVVRNRHTERQGCNANVLGTLDKALAISDRAVSLEDDILPGPDFLSFVLWGLDRFEDDPSVFSLCGYQRHDAPPPRDLERLVDGWNWFSPWGWATWRNRWSAFRSEVDVPSTGGVSWDCFLAKWVSEVRHLREMRTVVARIQNIGEEGTWVPSAEWQRENQQSRHWTGNLGWDPVPRDGFRLRGQEIPADASASADAPPPQAIRFCGQLFNFSGYARLGREAVAGLMDADVRVTADPLLNDAKWFEGISPDDRARWTELLKRSPEPGLLVCCDVPRDAHGTNELFRQMEEANPGCHRRAGWTMFETDRLPDGWAESLNLLDEVWVPSEFNRRTFAEAGVDPSKLHVVPGGIDPLRYAQARPLDLPGHKRGTTFLSVFQWVRRKGWDALLRAWSQAFDPKADVRLVLRCHPFGKPVTEMRRIFEESLRELGLDESRMAPILLMEGFVPESDLPSLYAASDVFVLPTRGEGWGLPYLEAMAAGKPCIATAWGASMEFLDEDCAWLVPPRELVPVGDAACRENPYLSPDHHWADPDPTEVARCLRSAASDVELRLKKALTARDRALKWNHFRTAQAIAARLESPRDAALRTRVSPVLSVSSNRRLTGALEKVARGLVSGRSERPAAPLSTPAASPVAPISVRWEGSQFLHHSLAHVNRELCLRLAKRGHDLSILPFEPDQFGSEGDPDLSILAKLHGAPLEGPCQVHVRHQWPPNLDAPAEGRWVVVQPWEFGSPPSDWMVPFRDRVDEVWCYTEHVRRTYLEAGLPADRLRVVPLGVDSDRFRPGLDPLPGLERDPSRTTFLFVGGTIARKGFDVLLNAWREAFGPSDPVRLVVKDMGGKTTYKGQTGESMVRELNASGKAAPVLYFDQDLSPSDLPRVYACADVLVHPYRGEGFGLPVAEAMASGLPVVVTRGGSTDDFCSDAESWGIPARRTAVPGGRVGPFETLAAPWWLEPSVPDLVALLREVAGNPAARRAKGDAARKRILSGWTWDHAARAAEAALAEVASRPRARREGPAPTVPVAAVVQVSGTPSPRTVPDDATLESLNKILFRAEAATARGDLAEAEDATREAVERHPDIPLAWLARAMILRGLGKIPQAAQSVQKSIALEVTPEALLESVQVHRLAGRQDLAKDHEKLLKKGHAPWIAATKALYAQKGQAWPLAAPGKAAKKSAAPPLKKR